MKTAAQPSKNNRLTQVNAVVDEVRGELVARQSDEGHWVFDLEADATIPAEYILLNHFLDDIEEDVEASLGDYLRNIQGEHGGWPLFHGGNLDISASVKAYFALKMIGDDIEAPHMKRARKAILAKGGAARGNVFARFQLALYGEMPWRAVPVMPVEIMFLPRWFPFHLSKVSYWSRTVIAPMLVLMALKPTAKNPRGVHIAELFTIPPEAERRYNTNPTGSILGACFLGLDHVLRALEPFIPTPLRRAAIERATAWFTERLNGEDGLGGIYPAIANSVMAYRAMGYSIDHPDYAIALKAVRKLLTLNDERKFCQPCLSPIWDTSLATLAMMEAGEPANGPVISKACAWMKDRQILDVKGDWAETKPDVAPGGWAFQYWNDYYPDVDDTAVVAMGLHRAGMGTHETPLKRATDWIIGMQSKNGGWGAFDVDNAYYYLNHIPFADHGALLDPPTSDVSARCVSMLAQFSTRKDHATLKQGLDFLRNEQEPDGSWFGRWGCNYIYGTWSALCAFNAAGEDMSAPHIRKAVEWLKSRQREDGGWGEDGATYWEEHRDEVKASTPSQTAWALMALMSAGEIDSQTVQRGVDYLLQTPRKDGRWDEKYYNAVGFPRVFYITYHGYAAYFPLWALARYRNLISGNASTVIHGM
ncbi:MAG: squalene--hopene cyclase [Rhodospirillaceae bacterium]|jgi:squalene-hopene/tetraprenyl-beta-curcumene cyclase|nr:squalene--hopene cyclase [Rhodospirillaceae bacterium]MBT5660110.1 squalene--hopene cyclase [Rhodospirillaceae bacterium]MBT5752188.1 squalene--hopene cyclase [Rhodospirillaceae bacterium]